MAPEVLLSPGVSALPAAAAWHHCFSIASRSHATSAGPGLLEVSRNKHAVLSMLQGAQVTYSFQSLLGDSPGAGLLT